MNRRSNKVLTSWLLAAYLLAGAFLAPRDLHAAAAFVQECQNWSGTGSTTITCTFASGVGAGSLIACFAAADTGSATVTWSDNGTSNTYTTRTDITDATDTVKGYVSYSKNNQGGTTIVTATFSTSLSNRAINCHEASGVDGTSPDDGYVSNIQTSFSSIDTDALTSTEITTTANGDYIFGITYDAAKNCLNVNEGTGYTGHTLTGCNPPRSEHQIQSSAGLIAAKFTKPSGTSNFITIIQAFKAGSGGGAACVIGSSPVTSTLDNTTRANENPISNASGPGYAWNTSGSFEPGGTNPLLTLVSNAIPGQASGTNAESYFNSDFSADSEATITMAAVPTNPHFLCIFLRIQNPGSASIMNGIYGCFLPGNATPWVLGDYINSTGPTTRATNADATTIVNGDKFRVQVIGTTSKISYFHSGAWTTTATYASNTVAGVGKIGVELSGASTEISVTTVVGGPVSGCGPWRTLMGVGF